MIQVFKYIPELDCFVCRSEFTKLVQRLGLTEWTPVVWMGRLFRHDQDYGEHWHDRWDEREAIIKLAKEKGLGHLLTGDSWDEETLGEHADFALVVVPECYYEHVSSCIWCQTPAPDKIPCPNPDCKKAQPKWAEKPRDKQGEIYIRPDGPCHSDEIRKLFWTDVMKSLHVSLDTLFALARDNNQNEKEMAEKYTGHEFYIADLEERIAQITKEYAGVELNDT